MMVVLVEFVSDGGGGAPSPDYRAADAVPEASFSWTTLSGRCL